MRGSLRGRLTGDGAAAAGVVLVAGLFLWEVVTGIGVLVARDVQMFSIPQKHLLWEALQAGELPLWTPHIGNGAPLLANFQSGVFYPPHWLFAVAPFLPAFSALVVFHFALGGVGSFFLARRLGMDRTCAAATAFAFMLGGYFASLLNLINALQAAAWIPVLAAAALRHLERRSLLSFVGLTAAGLLGLLAGEPQTFALGGIFTALLVLSRWPRGGPARGHLALAGSLALAGLWVGGLAMAQLMPTADLVAHSHRAAEGLSFAEAAFYSVEPIRLVNLILPAEYRDPVYRFGVKPLIGPNDPWLFSLYLGGLFLLFFAVAWRNAERRAEVAWLTAALVAGVVLGLGEHTPLYRWLYEIVPGVASFRFPAKFFLFTGLACALLTGYGLEALRRRCWSRLDLPAALLILAALAAGLVLVVVERARVVEWMAPHFISAVEQDSLDFAYRVWTQNLAKLLALVAIAVTLIVLFRRGVLRDGAFAGLVLALILADLAVAHRTLNPTVDSSFYRATPQILDRMRLEQVQRDYRYWATGLDENAGSVRVVKGVALEAQKWMWQQTLQPNTGQLRGVLQSDTWDALKLRGFMERVELLRELPDAGRRWRLLQLASVRYLYSIWELEGGPYAREIATDSLPGHLFELNTPLPRAYVASRVRWYADEEALMNAILSPAFVPHDEVALLARDRPIGAADHHAPADPVLPADSGAPAARSQPAGSSATAAPSRVETGVVESSSTAEILPTRSGDEVRVRVSIESPGYLVLTDNHYPGWRAFVDGEEREIVRANRFFRAVPVRPGDAEAVFRYRSVPLERGMIVSLAALLLGIVGLVLARRRGLGEAG